MKKSEMYKKAMLAVLESDSISSEDKLEIARELIEREDLELFREKRAEEEEAEKVRIPESTIAEVRAFEEAEAEENGTV